MEALSVSELKGLCLQRRLPVSGTKAELIERLVRGSSAASSARAGASASPAAATPTSDADGASSALFPSDYDALTIPQLKDLCRERVLPVGGIKDDIVARLKASDPRNMNLAQLKERCRDAALPVTGTKSDLMDRVMKSMSSGTTALLQTKSVEELKDLCRERGVGVTGKKDELIERIKQASTASSATTKVPSEGSAERSTPPCDVPKKSKAKATAVSPSYVFMTIPQLKDLCREKKLMVGGTKDELVERLEKAASQPPARPSSASKSSTPSASTTAPASVAASTTTGDSGYEAMMVPQLKDLCRSRTLPVMGTKDELVKRLKEHDDVVRAMFKKRKSASSDSILTSSTAAPTASSGKRKAGTDEPKAKKAKVSGTKAASSSMRPPVAKNVSAFAMPATTTYTARKSAPTKAKASAATASTGNGCYVVYSTFAYPPDGFHSYAGPGEPKYYGSYATKEEANARVNTLFYYSNPWGLDKDELDDNHDIDEDWKDGLLRLEVCPPDSEQWVVAARDTGVVAGGNVSAPSTMAARKSVPAKAKKQSVQSSTANGRYLVYSTCAYPPDGFHSYQGPGEPEYYGRYATKEEANDRVNTLFYHNNPWGLGADEMDENQDIDEDWEDGLLRLEVCPPDSEQWVVGVKDVGGAADHDGDVIMVSGSDTEDEYRSGY